MKLKNSSASAASKNPTASVIQIYTAPSAAETPVGVTIDFHSAEFNYIDELNDCCGNYQIFEPLDGTITADMRHQMERRCNEAIVDSCVDHASSSKRDEIKTDVSEVPEVAPTVTIVSQGRTLIIDTDADRAIACGKRLGKQGLACTLLVTKNASARASSCRSHQLEFLEVNDVSVTGAFGGFSATINIEGKQRQLTQLSGGKAAAFDLVLDLQSMPSYGVHSLPMGYYSPGPDPESLQEVMEEIPEMRGQFIKPQFTALMKNRCIHGRSRTRDCLYCLDICPFGAIQSVDKNLFINHDLCQGCGCCAMVCPTDAMQMIQPSKKELLHKLRRRLEMCPERGDFLPTLIISDSETAGANMDERNHDRLIIFEVEQIGCVGLEMLLTALVYGAGRVIVACDPQNPLKIRKALEWQTQIACAILNGLGMPEDKVQFAIALPEDNHSEGTACRPAGPDARPGTPETLPEVFSLQHEKRTLIRLATQYLHDQFGAQQSCLPLPSGSPFGAVGVSTDRCTLCMACAVACPSGALSACGDTPRLSFRESRCHQCGLCETVCPEGAIRLEPRLLCDPERTEAQVVLHEAVPFHCIECGAPFASPAMITRMEHKLAGHWMYAGARQLRRLRMCRTCRTRDALASKDVT